MLSTCTLPALLLATGLSAQDAAQPAGADWPQWRGPRRDGVSLETGWSPEGRPEPLWTRQVGIGYSAPVIQGGRLYTLGHDEEAGLDTVWCLDAATGQELWTHRYPSAIWSTFHGGGALTTPAVADGRLYVTQREGRAYGFDAASGALLWERDYASELGLALCTHGSAGSPLVLDDMLVLNVSGTTLAVRKADGEPLWQTMDFGDQSYATPVEFDWRGRSLLAIFNGTGLVVLERETGQQLALHEWNATSMYANAATPIVAGERIFISSAYSLGCALLRFTGDALEPEWASRVMRNKTNGSVLWEGHLYGFDESMLKCVSLAGEERWRVRGLGMGSLGIAGGRLLVLSSKGELIVAEADPAEYRELSRAPVLDGGVAWTTPVLAGGLVYCRSSLGELVCRDHRGQLDRAAAAPPYPPVDPPAELPAPEALFARHVEAVGGLEAVGRHGSARLFGWIEIPAAGIERSGMVLELRRPNLSRLSVPLEPLGVLQRGFDGVLGWQLDPLHGDRLLEGAELRELRETGNFYDLFHAAAVYPRSRTEGLVELGGRPCFAVAAETPAGAERTLYFDAETGLFAGREGSGESLATFSAYRRFGDVRLPTRWTVLHPDSGIEETLLVEAVDLDVVGRAAFEAPERVRWLARSPAERAAAEAELAARHGELLGVYLSPYERGEGGEEGEGNEEPGSNEYTVTVEEGRLIVERPGRAPYVLQPPDDRGRWYFAGADEVYATFDRGPAGAAVALRIHGRGEERVLPRAAAPGPGEPDGPEVPGEPEGPGDGGLAAGVDARVERWLRGRELGLSVLVLRGTEVRLHRIYGRLPRPARGQPPAGGPSAAAFQLESLPRQFTAVLTAILVERGELSARDPLTRFFPDLPPFARAIEVRHLASLRSGLPDWLGPPGNGEPAGPLEFLRGLAAPRAPPGVVPAEGSLDHVLLAKIAERIGGQRLPELLDEHLFRPLGMEHTGWEPPPAEAGVQEVRLPTPGLTTVGYGQLRTTPADIERWDRALFGGELVPEESLGRLFDPDPGETAAAPGFGWRRTRGGAAPPFLFTGRIAGRHAWALRAAEGGHAVILESDAALAGAPDLAEEIAELLL